MSTTREQRRLQYEQLIGHRLAEKYQITGLLGFGGMGAVYEATQSPMGRKVALKLIPTHNLTAAARFEREAYTVSQLVHPNTVTVFDFGQAEDGHLYLSMEHLEGQTLSDLIKAEAPLSSARVVHIASQICRALGEAHRLGIIHRDIKPDNIFLINVDGDTDYVKVLDFGIAKALHGEEDVGLTAEGRIVGTPRYMAPEQILAQPTDHRSDIYSLGCIMFEMLCAGPPFEQQSTAALMMSHAQQAPPSFAARLTREQLSQMPAGLESVVHQTMAKNPAARPQTTEHLRHKLEQALRINQAYDLSQGPPTQNVRPLEMQHQVPTPSSMEPQTGDYPRQTGDYFHAHPPTQDPAAYPAHSHSSLEIPVQPQSRIGLIVAIAALVLLLGIMITWMISSKEGTQPPAVKPEMVVTQVAKDTSLKTIHLVSFPKGAQVLDAQEKVIGTTPMTLEASTITQMTTYTLRHPGYDKAIFTLVPNHLEASYSAVLNKKREVASDKPSKRDGERVKKTTKAIKKTKKSTKKKDPPVNSQPPDTSEKKPPVKLFEDPAPDANSKKGRKIQMLDDDEPTTSKKIKLVD